VAGTGRETGQGRGRRSLALALAASLSVHLLVLLALALWPRRVPAPPAREPLEFTLLERAAPIPEAPATSAPSGPRRPGLRTRAPGPPGETGAGAGHPAPSTPDAPLAGAPAGAPSLGEMSARAAAAVVQRRGPERPAGDSVGGRVSEMLHRGVGERAVARGGFWDAYFTEVRQALLASWPAARTLSWTGLRRTVRVRLILDAEGTLRDFDLLGTSGDAVMDREVEEGLRAARFPSPPELVLHGLSELVTEWHFTVHPGLAPKPGTPVLGPLGVGIAFDLVTLFDPHVDLTPLERNVTLAAYWTR